MGRRLRQDFLQRRLLRIFKKNPTDQQSTKDIILDYYSLCDLQSYVFWLQAARHAVLEDIAASVGTTSANVSAKTSRQVKNSEHPERYCIEYSERLE